jgi:hypothetical protein
MGNELWSKDPPAGPATKKLTRNRLPNTDRRSFSALAILCQRTAWQD